MKLVLLIITFSLLVIRTEGKPINEYVKMGDDMRVAYLCASFADLAQLHDENEIRTLIDRGNELGKQFIPAVMDGRISIDQMPKAGAMVSIGRTYSDSTGFLMGWLFANATDEALRVSTSINEQDSVLKDLLVNAQQQFDTRSCKSLL